MVEDRRGYPKSLTRIFRSLESASLKLSQTGEGRYADKVTRLTSRLRERHIPEDTIEAHLTRELRIYGNPLPVSSKEAGFMELALRTAALGGKAVFLDFGTGEMRTLEC